MVRSKTNLLFVLLQVAAGGSERVVLDLARNLDPSQFNVYAAFFSPGDLLGAFRVVCQEVFHVRKRTGFDPVAILRLSRIINKKRIDVINAHHYMPYFYSYFASKVLHRRVLMYTEHSVPEVVHVSSGGYKWLTNMLLGDTNRVIGVSSEITAAFTSGFSRHSSRFVCIPNGVDAKRFEIDMERDRAREELGFLRESFVIGMIANFRKVKNHVCLVRAFSRLSDLYPQLRLVLVGKGYPGDSENSEEEVRRLIDLLGLKGRVMLTGYRADIPRLLGCFDAFCLPSLSEGLPVSILEAMASGVVVVGSNVRGIREVVFPNENGLLFPSNDEQALAETLRLLIEKPELRKSLAKRGYRFVLETCGMRQWMSKYEELFRV